VSSSISISEIRHRDAAAFIGCFFGVGLALVIAVGAVNLAVDPSRVFGLSLRDEGQLATMLADGSAAIVDPIVNLHVVRRELLNRSKALPQVMVFGSSRSWELSQDMFPGRRFFNGGTSSATLDDYIAMWGLLEPLPLKPELVIFEADPWIFNRANPPLTHCMKLADEFRLSAAALGGVSVSGCLGRLPYGELFSLPRLTTSMIFLQWLHADRGCGGICPVPPDADMPARGDLWHPDGSLNHYRIETAQAVDAFAREQGETSPRFKFFERMKSIDTRMVDDWRKLLAHIQASRVSVMIYLSPFHPGYLAGIAGHEAGDIELLDEVEATLRRIAGAFFVPVVGSYRPNVAGCGSEEFYDSIHVHPSCIKRLLANRGGSAVSGRIDVRAPAE
jgi:hypothetical protein